MLQFFVIFGALAGAVMGFTLAVLGVAVREAFRGCRTPGIRSGSEPEAQCLPPAEFASGGSERIAIDARESSADPDWTWLTDAKHTLLWAGCTLYAFFLVSAMLCGNGHESGNGF
jgi:hypothetical protein